MDLLAKSGGMFSALKKLFKKAVEYFGYKITRTDHSNYFEFRALVNHYLKSCNTLTFIQIGGCDGISFDPLYHQIMSKPERFEGIIIEPVEAYFKELSARYHTCKNIKTLRYAIHNEKKEMIIYRPDSDSLPDLPGYAKGVASFDKSHLLKFNIPFSKIVSEKVPCISLKEVMTDYKLKPDLLAIDTEGYDAEIILNYDFSYHKPSLIFFEHGFPDKNMSETDLSRVIDVLHQAGYEIIFDFYDATAYQKDRLFEAFSG